jgi:hypothetical protein
VIAGGRALRVPPLCLKQSWFPDGKRDLAYGVNSLCYRRASAQAQHGRLRMKTVVLIGGLMWLSCAVLLAQSSENSSTKEGLPCAKPNPEFGYASDLRLPKSDRVIKLYNIDYPETHKHDPICLSQDSHDTILWVSGSGKRFKLKIYLEKGQNTECGQHPFQTNPPTDTIDGHFSGPLKRDVPKYCLYEVELQTEGGQVSDPHIQTVK